MIIDEADDLATETEDQANAGGDKGAGDQGGQGDKGAGDKGAGDQGDKGQGDKGAGDKGAGDKGQDDKGAGDKGTKTSAGKKTIAAGGDAEADDKAAEEADDKSAADKAVEKTAQVKKMREDIANHYAAGDKKVFAAEMRRLERLGIDDPAKIYGLWRELEGKFTGGGLVKMPGKGAKPEEIAEFQKALGWTEKPEDMIKEIKLENGAVIGEADKPVLNGFLAAVHGAVSAQDFASKATNWYYKNLEDEAARLDEADDSFRRESERALKDEMGPAFKRQTGAIASLFATAPGGANVDNPQSLYARLMGGRTADGRLIGNDPEMTRFLVGLVSEINPAATVTEDGNQSGKSIDAELAEIDKVRRENRQTYNKDEKLQARERELLDAQAKIQARG